MLKSLLFGVHFLGFLILGMVVPKDVKMSHTTPVFATHDEETQVSVFFEKGKIDGFAKYQINVPPGMTITPVETKGASFTFKDGQAKFIWMALPEESEFQIDYTLKIEPACKIGNNDIEQWFSYLEKNERRTIVLPLHVVEVAGDDLSNSSVDEGLAHATRTITKMNGDHFLVEIALYKDGIKGFAKLQERFPDGLNAEAVKKANGVPTQLDSIIKFVWFSIPEEENLKIVYELFSKAPDFGSLKSGDIVGQFTYLKENDTKTIEIQQGEFKDISADMAVDGQSLDSNVVDNDTTDIPSDTELAGLDSGEVSVDTTNSLVDVTPDITEPEDNGRAGIDTSDVATIVPDSEVTDPTPAVTDPIPEKVPTLVDIDPEATADITPDKVVEDFGDITNVPSPDQGVAYRVQIAAGHNVVDEIYFAKRHKFVDTFDLENHQGWVKYTTGAHDEYKLARDSRNYINNNYNFDGPFVTAYNQGVRITVQEALMISRQKWYQ